MTAAMVQLAVICGGLPARAAANAWWPYHGRAESRSSARRAEGPTLAAGEDSAVVNWRMGAAHLQRALVAVEACHAGERWRWERRRLRVSQLPAELRSPADCDRMARVLAEELAFLLAAVDDPDVTGEVLDMLKAAVDEIGDAHDRFSRAAPAVQSGGRGRARRPTRPARKGGG